MTVNSNYIALNNVHLKFTGRRRRKVAELSQEEKEAIMMSDDFHKFFDRTTRLMERAMCEDHQSLFVDYTGRIKRVYVCDCVGL